MYWGDRHAMRAGARCRLLHGYVCRPNSSSHNLTRCTLKKCPRLTPRVWPRGEAQNGGGRHLGLAPAIPVQASPLDVPADAFQHVFSVTSRLDSGEEDLATGTMSVGSPVLGLVQYEQLDGLGVTEERAQLVGVVFPSVALPPGAVVHAARCSFVTETIFEPDSTREVSVSIFGERTASADAPKGRSRDLSARPVTEARVEWAPAAAVAVCDELHTADISAVVREIIALPGWRANNSLAVMFAPNCTRPEGVRWVAAFAPTRGSVQTPALEVSWSSAPLAPPAPPAPPSSPSEPP
eukprot:4743590-Prymnesium_polylepis.1